MAKNRRKTQDHHADHQKSTVVVLGPGKEKPIELWPGEPFHMDRGQCEIWRLGDDGEFYLFGSNGAPAVLRCVCPKGRPAREDAAPGEVFYQIEWRWPDGSATDAEWFSAQAIRKGWYLDRFGISRTSRHEIDRWAGFILAQRRAFKVPIEYPVRHSGWSGADEAPAYVLHDGRALRPGGKIDAGTIAGEPPLLQQKRADRWADRFQNLPAEPPSEEQLRAAIDALLIFDRKGRAFCAALLGIRALFYSLQPMSISVFLSGLKGTAKTSIAQIMHWAEGPCAAMDEPDVSFRTTGLGGELSIDRARDGAYLIDDGKRTRPEAGAPLEPDWIKLQSDYGRAAFDGAPFRVRGDRHYALAQQRRVQQLLVFSAETALGLEPSLLARQIWWSFEKDEIERVPMLARDWLETPAWIACQEPITAAGHSLIRRVLDMWAIKGRPAAINFIREIDREASELAGTIELGGTAEDRPRICRGMAMIIAGGILCDAAAGTGTMMRDLALKYGAQLAQAQLDRLASGSIATAGFDLDWFLPVYDRFVGNGDYLLLDAETGEFFRSADQRDATWLPGIGYRWDNFEKCWVPGAKPHGGWRHRTDGEDWIDPAKFLTECERRAKAIGSAFPFKRQTLAAHLRHKAELTVEGNEGNLHKPYIPRSDPRYPDKGSQPRVFRIPFVNAETNAESAGRDGRPGEPTASDCNDGQNALPASPGSVSRLAGSRENFLPEAGRHINEPQQQVTPPSPGLPSLPAQNGIDIAISPENGEPIENIEQKANASDCFLNTQLQSADNADEIDESTIVKIAAANAAAGASSVERMAPAAAELLDLGKRLGHPHLAGFGTGPWSTISEGEAGWQEFVAAAPDRIVSAIERAKRRLAREARGNAAPAPAERPEADRPAIDASTDKTASSASAEAPAPMPVADAAKPRAPAGTADREKWPQRIVGLEPERLYLLAPGGSIEQRPIPPELRPENASRGRLAAFMIPERITQLWVPRSYADRLASDALVDDDGLPEEWSFGTSGKRDAWLRANRDRQEIFIVVPHRDRIEADSAAALIEAVHAFHAATGFSWRLNGAVVFDIMAKALHKHGLDMRGSVSPAAILEPMRRESIIESWMRGLSDQERAAKYVQVFDKNGYYLGAMSSLAVGFGEPVYRAEPDFNPAIGGYWQARVTMPGSWPHLHENRKDPDGFAWYVTPTLAFAAQLGATIEVREAYVFPEQHYPLTPIYKRLRDARKALALPGGNAIALKMVKSVYTRGIGNLKAGAKFRQEKIVDLLRPDWRHFIIANARANMTRNLLKHGLQPFGVRTDAIFLTSDSADRAVAAGGLPLDPIELNAWKHLGCIRLDEIPASFFSERAIRNPQDTLDRLKELLTRKGSHNGA